MKASAGESLVEGEQPCAAEAASLLAIACRLATPAAENKKILIGTGVDGMRRRSVMLT